VCHAFGSETILSSLSLLPFGKMWEFPARLLKDPLPLLFNAFIIPFLTLSPFPVVVPFFFLHFPGERPLEHGFF